MEFNFEPDVVSGSNYSHEGLTKVEVVRLLRAVTRNRFSLKYYKDVTEYNLGSRRRYSYDIVGALIAAWYESGDLDKS
jgi:hypothetical protein